jgi:multicomponent Na+:H+ antiporter subunit B
VNAILEVIAPRLLGPALMFAAAIIVKGYTDVGDGFSAGVVVTLAIALRYITLGGELTERSLPVLRHAPVVAATGLLIALAVGFAGVAMGDPPFTHYPGPGEDVMTIGALEIITAVQAMALTALVIGLAVTALLLALVLRVVRAYRSNALDDVAQEEAERAERLERRDARAHEDEEAAAR